MLCLVLIVPLHHKLAEHRTLALPGPRALHRSHNALRAWSVSSALQPVCEHPFCHLATTTSTRLPCYERAGSYQQIRKAGTFSRKAYRLCFLYFF